MSTYVIGDVQGCYASLQALLEKVHFSPESDCLWFVGDLVNRGPDSLSVLRYIKKLGTAAIAVLGNHDLHLLAVAAGLREQHSLDTLNDILQAPDREELLNWLRHLPLLHYDKHFNCVMTHAGILPAWTLAQAKAYAQEVEQHLQGEHYLDFLKNMYGNEPHCWHDDLLGNDRYRFIFNAFTRMRFCDAQGCLNLTEKGRVDSQPAGLFPWFTLPSNIGETTVLFGHWAALRGMTSQEKTIALDMGCVWGGGLTAYCLESQQHYAVKC